MHKVYHILQALSNENRTRYAHSLKFEKVLQNSFDRLMAMNFITTLGQLVSQSWWVQLWR